MNEEDERTVNELFRMTKRETFLYYTLWAPQRVIRDFFLRIRFAWQRAYRGYDDGAYWSLDCYLAKIAAPVLKDMIKNDYGYPDGLTPEQWTDIQLKIYKAMKLIAEDKVCLLTEEEHTTINEGTELLGKWFVHLWT